MYVYIYIYIYIQARPAAYGWALLGRVREPLPEARDVEAVAFAVCIYVCIYIYIYIERERESCCFSPAAMGSTRCGSRGLRSNVLCRKMLLDNHLCL